MTAGATLTRDSTLIEAARRRWRKAHDAWRLHWSMCGTCQPHRLCPVGRDLERDADSAGERLTLAVRR